MAKEYYCYPREGFVPEVCTHEGLSLAHAQGTVTPTGVGIDVPWTHVPEKVTTHALLTVLSEARRTRV